GVEPPHRSTAHNCHHTAPHTAPPAPPHARPALLRSPPVARRHPGAQRTPATTPHRTRPRPPAALHARPAQPRRQQQAPHRISRCGACLVFSSRRASASRLRGLPRRDHLLILVTRPEPTV